MILQPDRDFYSILITTGLFFSFIGDIFLIKEKQYFIQGLVSFLVAHFFYIAAFFRHTALEPIQIAPLLAIIIISIIIFRRLQDNLRALTLPVMIYMTAIGIMVWRALCRIGYEGILGDGVWLAAIGALFFMASDTFLALHKFHRPLKHRTNLVMITYYLGQYGIALSALSFIK